MSENEKIKNMTKKQRDAYANEHNPNNPNYIGKNKQPTKPKESPKLSNNRINHEMHELEKLLKYKFKEISLLAEAMNSTPIGSHEHVNERLAIVGDAILDTVIADMLYLDKSNKTKQIITEKRKDLVKNAILHRLTNDKGFIQYAYNESYFFKDNPPKDNKVVNKKHDAYIEAIIGAIYYDASYKAVKVWIKDHILEDMKRIGAKIKNK